MAWIEKRAEFQKRFDDLSQENVQALITDLNQAVGNYISTGGISQDPNNNPNYNTIRDLTNRAEGIKDRYARLNDDIVKYLSETTKDQDLINLLRENGELQKQVNKLEKIVDEMKVDVVSAVARDELLRSRDTNVTRHQLFILDRPIRRGLIPYLWVVSILFIGVGLVIFRMTMPTIVFTGSPIQILIEVFTNKVVLGSLLISALIVILFLSLKIAGVFGK